MDDEPNLLAGKDIYLRAPLSQQASLLLLLLFPSHSIALPRRDLDLDLHRLLHQPGLDHGRRRPDTAQPLLQRRPRCLPLIDQPATETALHARQFYTSERGSPFEPTTSAENPPVTVRQHVAHADHVGHAAPGRLQRRSHVAHALLRLRHHVVGRDGARGVVVAFW